jgi:DNA-binding winged helix-turn-helix (wHTH) protein
MQVRFGRFVLDPDARELRRGDEPVPLSPKAFELLSLLVSHRPKAMAKNDLLERLWPETFVVEKNLANLISEVRDAIDDDPSDARFIRTVHRFGYAFRDTNASPEADRRAKPTANLLVFVQWVSGRVSLDEGAHMLGRDPDVAIFLDSPGVSRRHAVLTLLAGEATIEDLGSKNGTFVADRRVEGSKSLSDGDIIRVGSVSVTFRMLQSPTSTQTEPDAGVTR